MTDNTAGSASFQNELSESFIGPLDLQTSISFSQALQSLVRGNLTEGISNIKLRQYFHIKDVAFTNLAAVLLEKPTGAPEIAVLTYNASNSLCTVPMCF